MAKFSPSSIQPSFQPSRGRVFLTLLVLAAGVAGLVHAGTTTSQDASLADAIAAQRDRAYGDSPSAAVLNDLGNLLVLDGQTQAAIEAYRRALDLDPAHLPSGFNLGLLLDGNEQQAESLKVFEGMLEQHPKHARTHYQIGSLLERSGKRQAAIHAYVTAFQLDPFLALPDVNPQITDNDLVTEALLRVEVALEEEDQTPRIYAEPSRVAALLLPSHETKDDPSADEASVGEVRQADSEEPNETSAATPREVGPEDLRSSSARSTAVEQRLTASAPSEDLSAEEDTSSARTLGAEDLSNTRINQASPSAGGRASARRTPANRRATTTAPRRAPAASTSRSTGQPRATPPAGARSQSEAPARPRSTSPTRFRPGRRSSAQMELRIVPPAGTPSLAAAGGAR